MKQIDKRKNGIFECNQNSVFFFNNSLFWYKINQIMEKTHKRKLYKKMFKCNEMVPKTHGFIDGIKDLKVSDIAKINKNIIKKSKENKIYRKGTKAISAN